MSPSKKPDGPRCMRRTHITGRHGAAAASEPAAEPPLPMPAEPTRVPITFDGRHIGDLHVRPGTDQELLARALDQLATRTEWSKLGASLAALGAHRLVIAARAASAASGGGRGVSAEEEEHIAQWFVGVVDEAIRRGGLRAAGAIWFVLAGDDHADPYGARPPRCPVVAEVPHPPRGFAFEPDESDEPDELGEPDEPDEMTPDLAEVAAFLAKLRAAAAGYVHTAIAGASDSDLLELREIVCADDDALEDYRPWGVDLAGEVPSSELLESARSMLTCRHVSNAEACGGFVDWARGFAGVVVEHALPPVLRVGAVAWLARVALRDEERAA